MFDQLSIEIDYKSLVDAKTQINEIVAEHKNLKIRYHDTKDNDNFVSRLYINEKLAGTGISLMKKTAQILAAEEGLPYLEKEYGILKAVPDRYSKFSEFIW